jgi:hypothetical protein
VEFVSGGHLGAGYGFRSVDPSTPGLSTGKRLGVAKVEVTEPGVEISVDAAFYAATSSGVAAAACRDH